MKNHKIGCLKSVCLCTLAFVLYGCAGSEIPEETGAVEEATTTTTAPLMRVDLVAQGFAYVRTDTLNYVISGGSTPSGFVCVGSGASQVCYSTYRESGTTETHAFADRFEHADGRIAYVVAEDRVVGPIRIGTYSDYAKGLKNFWPDSQGTLRVFDLVITSTGSIAVSVSYTVRHYVTSTAPAYDSETRNFLSAKNGRFGACGNHLGETFCVDFDSLGFLSEFRVVHARDSYTMSPTDMSVFSHPTRSTATCEVPYDCVRTTSLTGGEKSVWLTGRYPNSSSCAASCRPVHWADYSKYKCLPSLQACGM